MLKRFAVIGSGPSGMYTTKYLLKQYLNCQVDIFESLPVPFGLIRYGVAPDHQDVKSVETDFNSILQHQDVNYFGNVTSGRDISINELKGLYSAVFLCYGANADKDLSLGENKETQNIFSAREFVYWYNGHPYFTHIKPNLKGSRNAIIIGQGNVAIDCARILAKSTKELKTTDISEQALDVLAMSSIKKINIVGRRGPIQAAFTIKELRELSKLEGSCVRIPSSQFYNGLNDYSLSLLKKNRAKKRIFELMNTFVGAKSLVETDKVVEINFLLSPDEVHTNGTKLFATTFIPQQLKADSESVSKMDNSWKVTLDSDLLIKSIGFTGEAPPDQPSLFNKERGILNHNGVGHVEDNIFTAGWIKRGATGIVGTNIVCAKQTLSSIDIKLRDTATVKQDIETMLEQKNIRFVSKEAWMRINDEEIKRGEAQGKIRSKIKSVHEMIEIAGS